MKLQLLVDAPAFRHAMAADLAEARRSAFVQTLTFEGDAVGKDIAALLQACPAGDRRVIVDYFTWHVLSDRMRWRARNLVSPSVWGEAWQTRRMFRRLRASGVGVRFVNRAGPFFWHFPARNHKKLVALDGRVVYIGGINYSDHNFAWHDLMLRIEDERVTAFLEEDFRATWEGRQRGGVLRLPDFELHSLDGQNNEAVFDEVFDLLARAQQEIFIECPYITDPVTRELTRAARRGVRVTVLMPEQHNWPLMREGLARGRPRAARSTTLPGAHDAHEGPADRPPLADPRLRQLRYLELSLADGVSGRAERACPGRGFPPAGRGARRLVLCALPGSAGPRRTPSGGDAAGGPRVRRLSRGAEASSEAAPSLGRRGPLGNKRGADPLRRALAAADRPLDRRRQTGGGPVAGQEQTG